MLVRLRGSGEEGKGRGEERRGEEEEDVQECRTRNQQRGVGRQLAHMNRRRAIAVPRVGIFELDVPHSYVHRVRREARLDQRYLDVAEVRPVHRGGGESEVEIGAAVRDGGGDAGGSGTRLVVVVRVAATFRQRGTEEQ